MTFVETERARLIDTLRTAGPDAPTLCEGWTTRDLLIHLINREIQPHQKLMAKVPLDAVSSGAKQAVDHVESAPYEELLETFRDGRQKYSPLQVGAIDKFTNVIEYTLHHEDVRRAPGSELPTRALTAEEQSEVFAAFKVMAQALLATSPVQVILRSPEHGEITVQATRLRTGSVTVVGEPIELALWAYGREDQAAVTLEGDARFVEKLKAAKRGI